jgi:hypothetical protein
VPEVPTTEELEVLPVRLVDPAVPAPAGPHGSVVLPIVLDGVVPVPCVDVVVVPVLVGRPCRPAAVFSVRPPDVLGGD